MGGVVGGTKMCEGFSKEYAQRRYQEVFGPNGAAIKAVEMGRADTLREVIGRFVQEAVERNYELPQGFPEDPIWVLCDMANDNAKAMGKHASTIVENYVPYLKDQLARVPSPSL